MDEDDSGKIFSGMCAWTSLGLLIMLLIILIIKFILFDFIIELMGWYFFALWGAFLIGGGVGAYFIRKSSWSFKTGKALKFLILFNIINGCLLSITALPYAAFTVLQVYLPIIIMFALASLYSKIFNSSSISLLGLFGLFAALIIKFYLKTSWAAFALGIVLVIIFMLLTLCNILDAVKRRAAINGSLAVSICLTFCIAGWIFIIGTLLNLPDRFKK